MTPREHLGHVLSMVDDLLREVECCARLVEDDDAYWTHVENSLFDESMWVNRACDSSMRDEDGDETFTDDPELMARVDTMIDRARG